VSAVRKFVHNFPDLISRTIEAAQLVVRLFRSGLVTGNATRGLRTTNDESRFSAIRIASPAGMPIAIISGGRLRFCVGS
jgi:hypothetical protein